MIKFFKLGIVICAIGLFVGLFFTMYVIVETPVHEVFKKPQQLEKALQRNQSSKIIFEEGALVNKRELSSFYLFSAQHQTFDAWFKEQLDNSVLSMGQTHSKNQLFIQEQFSILGLLTNDCTKMYCYQQRLPFDQIPSIFWKGLIGIEDYRYLEHFGIDIKSIARAIFIDIGQMKLIQGGSTLTQQLVKNLFLHNKKTFIRKIKEVIISIYIEALFSKEDILQGYFNEVFWGSLQGIRIKGVHAASLYYFGITPNMVTPFQAAILISLLKGPNYYHPIKHLDRLIARANSVFLKLVKLNLFPQTVQVWDEQRWQKWQKQLIRRNEQKHYKILWSVQKSKSSLLNSYENFVMQVASNNIIEQARKKTKKQDIAVKIYIEKVNDPNKSFSFYSKTERNLPRALRQEKHQVGSTLKPIIYSIFNSLGISMDDMVPTAKVVLKLKSGSWSPREAHAIKEPEVTLFEALMKSYNRPVIRLAQDIGFDVLERELQDLIPDLKVPLSEYPAQLLGALELSVMDLHELYAKLINRECSKEDFEQSILNLLSDPSKTTIRKIVGSQLKNLKFFGKTGTSNNGYDNWFVFYDGSLLGVIWVGYEGVKGKQSFELYGGSTAFLILQHFFLGRGQTFSELSCNPI
ncbi:MAG: transglycosylase domain-containing protein [Bacteriovoracaceae bacterium]|nr:transglycosylase domain-containing protein [Bacteriovoracaceae bacterium]